MHSSFHWQKFEIDEFCRDFRRPFSCHASKECLRLLRPLLKILVSVRELIRPSVFPNLSCREIVDGTYFFCKSSLIINLSLQCANCLLKLCDNLPLWSFQNRQTDQFVDFVFHFRQMLLLRFTRADSRNKHVQANFTVSFACPPNVPSAELPKPVVHHNNKRRATMTKLCAQERHVTKQGASTIVTPP